MAENNPAFDIRDTLINDDSVTTPIYIGQLPVDIDECIVIYNTAGEIPSPKFLLNYPGLQVRSRANTYATAYVNIQEIFELLLGRPSFIKNTTRYTGIWAKTGVFELERDTNERVSLAFNLMLITEPALGTQYRKSLG